MSFQDVQDTVLMKNASGHNPLKSLLESGLFNPEEFGLAYTSKHDASGRASAKRLVTSFCKRAAAAEGLTNFINKITFEQAMRNAREFDKHLADTGHLVGLLHGVRITVKDRMDLEGHDFSNGIAAYCFNPVK